VRMGVHTGEAEERDGDYFGLAVNRAARIMAAANGGQLVASAVTVAVIGEAMGVKLFDLGEVVLKGVVEPVQVFGVAGAGHEWVDVPLLTGQASRGNLPRLQTDFVGDLAELHRRVANLAHARLVTLTGSGGVGKTRAAMEVGWLVVDEFVDGVWWAELAPVVDGDLVVSAVATMLGAYSSLDMTLSEAVVDWCVGRRMLLILDNCEHVVDAVVDLVQGIVAECPTVTVIATSREPLGVAGEVVVRIPSLEQTFGVELFTMRAAAVDTSFRASPADLVAIGSICDRLDGIPLAIELAAARIRSLSPTELLERLDDRFRLLRGAGRGGLERHQTLRATVAWSYQLLDAETQLLFDRLSVFSGTFDLAAAEAICAGDGVDEYDVIDLISDLVDKSMVIATRSGTGTRYRLLETLRQYGEERLDDRTDTAHRRDVHLTYFTDRVQRLDEEWNTSRQPEVSTRFDDEWDNLVAAHTWALACGNLDDAGSILEGTARYGLFHMHRDHQELVERTRAAWAAVGGRAVNADSQSCMWALIDGDTDRAIEIGYEAIDVADSEREAAFISANLLLALLNAGRTEEAAALAPRVRALVESDLDDRYKIMAFTAIAYSSMETDDIGAAPERLVAYAERTDAPSDVFMARRMQAITHIVSSPPDFDQAIARCREAIAALEPVGATPILAELTMTTAMALSGHSETIITLRHVLARAVDLRYGLAIDYALEQIPVAIAAVAPGAAATIVGYVEQSPAPGGAIGRAIRAMSISAIDGAPGHARAAGAAMNRQQIVAYALNALDEVDTAHAPNPGGVGDQRGDRPTAARHV
jgi:predicted ATPase